MNGGTVIMDVLADDSDSYDSGEVLTVLEVTGAYNGTVSVLPGGTAVATTPDANFPAPTCSITS